MRTSLTAKTLPQLIAATTLLGVTVTLAQTTPITHDPVKWPGAAPAANSHPTFEPLADKAIAAMKARAEELKIQGVAVIAYAEGETVSSWSSKMAVVGKLKENPKEKDPGVNLLAIAYSKASEMADTLKHSGSGIRPPLKGEFGWQGGRIRKTGSGYLIAAFSGGKSEDDIKVSQAGLDALDSLR